MVNILLVDMLESQAEQIGRLKNENKRKDMEIKDLESKLFDSNKKVWVVVEENRLLKQRLYALGLRTGLIKRRSVKSGKVNGGLRVLK